MRHCRRSASLWVAPFDALKAERWMIVPGLLFMLSIVVAAYFQLSGPPLSGLVPMAGLMVVASLFLWLRAFWRVLRSRRAWIIVDGSNVMHWLDNVPTLDAVAFVLADLKQRGLYPRVWFDANVGYKVSDRYVGPGTLARHLGLENRQVRIAPRGTPADPLLLDDARNLKARVVTNDRFRDWAESHPQVTEPGFLVRGRLQSGKVTLHLARDEVGQTPKA